MMSRLTKAAIIWAIGFKLILVRISMIGAAASLLKTARLRPHWVIAARFAQIADHQPAQDARELIIGDDGKAAIILDLVKRVAMALIIAPVRRYLQELVADLGVEGGDSALLEIGDWRSSIKRRIHRACTRRAGITDCGPRYLTPDAGDDCEYSRSFAIARSGG
jgi:hypothetical protein